MTKSMTGARMVVQALKDQGVEVVFGYPGGAVLPIYDEIFQQNDIRHILVRHEQGAIHMAEGYARSTGKVGVALVTSGPGATNAVTGLVDALMDSIPIVVLTGQVPTFAIGTDAFQEADTVGITRPCTKMNWLVKDTAKLSETIHKAFHVARSGRPGPVLIDIPKDVQFADAEYVPVEKIKPIHYQPKVKGDIDQITRLVEMIETAERPVFYTGGGVINSGPAASQLLRELAEATGFPVTSTLMGLGAYPASGKNWLGMLGMHGLYEANLAMHGCDLMINIGARFDDRITGRIKDFSPHSRKAHIDIDASSINKVVRVDVPILGDVGHVLEDLLRIWKSRGRKVNKAGLATWWKQINEWRAVKCLTYNNSATIIKPQYALERLEALTKGMDRYITTEVGQHQMWAAQYYKFDKPRRWINSGGLGTMGFGLPAAMGVRFANPKATVACITGEGSIQMNIQELSTCKQFHLPVKILCLNNGYLGMVRQWQQMFHGNRYAESYVDALPDFVKLAEAYGHVGMYIDKPADVEPAIREAFVKHKNELVFLDFQTDKTANVFPMIAAGKGLSEMILAEEL
ncbi:acetolactate synthase 3 large subunit [Pseudotabrizicola sp.]|uniref:acetolactate synthase 3 large subunit n=1 Tax=Pseudotabrizicola sp. TaxID=2939647 RepID=UPI00271BC176|nr:acetolactate synthase 3 large subunit [Pseudotabrizicola sp.]MDO8884771.1 acetolactate synthase 3 large subunit [Pseudotabrizicola sp.]